MTQSTSCNPFFYCSGSLMLSTTPNLACIAGIAAHLIPGYAVRMPYRVTYEVEGVEGAQPGLSPKGAAKFGREMTEKGNVPVRIFDDLGHRLDLHALELAVRGTRFG